MAKEWTASKMGHKGGLARAEKHRRREIAEWGRRGGRPRKLDAKALARLERLLSGSRSQATCARLFGVSTRTIGRIVARLGLGRRKALRRRGE